METELREEILRLIIARLRNMSTERLRTYLNLLRAFDPQPVKKT